MNKIYSIQMLRGIASLLVLFLHMCHKLNVYTEFKDIHFNFGNIGVDIFFIISGFIMIYTYKESLTVKKFLIRRLIRIIPLYWLTLLPAIVAYLYFPYLVNGGSKSTIIYSFLLLPNELPFLNQNAWTLSYEFYFYLIFSVSIFLKCNKFSLPTIIIILLLSLIGINLDFSNILLGFLTSNLLIEFLFGFYLYFFVLYKSNKIFLVSSLCVSTLLALLILSNVINSDIRFVSLGIPALCLCLWLVFFEGFFKKYLSRCSSILGDMSYSLYLIHPFVLSGCGFVLSAMKLNHSPVFFVSILFLFSMISGYICFKYIEAPMSQYFLMKYKKYQ